MRKKFPSMNLGRYVLIIAGAMLLFPTFGLFTYASAASNDSAHDGRLVTIHDRGEDRVILTHAENIRDALQDAQISIEDKDTVEPGLDEPLVATDYTVNIYRARPVIVVDGAVRQKVMTAAQTSSAIVKAANLELHDEDKADLSASTDIVSDGAAVMLNIHRAKAFTLNLYGSSRTAYSQAKTVGEMLDDKNISLGDKDTLSVSRDTPLTADMTVEVWRDGVQTATVDEPIAYSVRKVQDFDQPFGYHKIQSPGTDGHKSVTYEIMIKNGKEVSRKAIQTVVLEQPKEQVEVVGAALPPGSHQDWMAAAGIASSNYGFVDYIMTHESHWNPASRNPSGLYVGLGQTSESKLAASCPNWQGDPICQLRFFSGYATSRYGGWSGAYSHWTSNNWW